MSEFTIKMPALPGAPAGRIVRWHVALGDRVVAGDVVADAAFGTTTLEIEAPEDGVIVSISATPGLECIAPGADLARLKPDDAVAVAEHAAQPPATTAPEVSPVDQSASPREPAAGDEKIGEMRTLTFREALRDALAEEMRRDPDVLLIGEDVGMLGGAHRVSEGLLDEFGPRRILDTPLTEQGFAGVGVGAALAGLKPVVEFMSWSVALPALSHIVNSAAKAHYISGGALQVPIVFRGPDGASPGAAAQLSHSLAAWLAHVPGLKIVAPSCAADAKGLLRSAIRDPAPVIVLECESLYEEEGEVPISSSWLVPIGSARIVRGGGDATLVAYGRGVAHALAAADLLAAEGVQAEVIDLRTLRPLDMETVVASVTRTGRLVTVDEGWPVCSVGSEIVAEVARRSWASLRAAPVSVAGADVPMPYAATLEALALPNAEEVAAAVRGILSEGMAGGSV
ncbi:MAG: pyruvate dehydrogenase complex E1 component subunit beta [Hyphomicrobiaceae bacterium]